MKDLTDTRDQYFELLEKPTPNTTSLSELEAEIGRILHRAGREMLQRCLDGLEERNPEPITRCRWCGEEACYVSNRVGFISTSYGQIRYRRAYYVCRGCCRSTCPLDERLKPFESLARLRARLESGNSIPVDELASAWGLGSLAGGTGERLDLHVSPSEIAIQEIRTVSPSVNA